MEETISFGGKINQLWYCPIHELQYRKSNTFAFCFPRSLGTKLMNTLWNSSVWREPAQNPVLFLNEIFQLLEEYAGHKSSAGLSQRDEFHDGACLIQKTEATPINVIENLAY